MALTLPTPVLVAAGLVGTGIDTLKRLPEELPALPVTLVGRAVRLSMKVQQEVAELAGRGEELLSGLTRGSGGDSPAWARFDDDDDDAPTSAMGRPADDAGDAADHDDQHEHAHRSSSSGPIPGGPAQAPTVLPDLDDVLPAVHHENTGPSAHTPADSPAAVAEADGTATTRTRRAAADAALDPPAGGSEALLAAAVGGEPTVGTAPVPTAASAPSASAPPASTPPVPTPPKPAAPAPTPTPVGGPEVRPTPAHPAARPPRPVPTSVDAVTPERAPHGLTAEDTARSAAAAARTRDAATTPKPAGPAVVPPTSAPTAVPSTPPTPSVAADPKAGTGSATATTTTTPTTTPDEPDALAGYSGMTVAQVRGHLGSLTAAQTADLLLFEQQHRGRAPFLTLLTNRITTLGQSAE
ncbi:hypothetical protein JL107_10610 [Nakamurella flavida]|uniref:Uncharacterized protein n=1 Tax=Nakamurella flavida TaxID=363630 RepID=A0A938YLI1_9ACTN|nr:hypothetical protein [Nakamurella flavida]MBM9476898.1 hypothetical protein [Nakamurella flavida]MDP9779842.1 hypothetical protein [Nakamurella flavida]